MIIENLEVIRLAKMKQKSVDTASDYFYKPIPRRVVSKTIHQLIVNGGTCNKLKLVTSIMNVDFETFAEYNIHTDEGFQSHKNLVEMTINNMIYDFSFIKEEGENVHIDFDEWIDEYEEAYNELKNRFTTTLEMITNKNIYMCSKGCRKIYDETMAHINNYRCDRAHELKIVPLFYKKRLIADFEHDIKKIDQILTPSRIIEEVNARAEIYGENSDKKTFNTNVGIFYLLHSYYVNLITPIQTRWIV